MKTYRVKDEREDAIQQLIDMGVVVVASNNKIIEIKIDEAIHNITAIEQITGLKFKEAER